MGLRQGSLSGGGRPGYDTPVVKKDEGKMSEASTLRGKGWCALSQVGEPGWLSLVWPQLLTSSVALDKALASLNFNVLHRAVVKPSFKELWEGANERLEVASRADGEELRDARGLRPSGASAGQRGSVGDVEGPEHAAQQSLAAAARGGASLTPPRPQGSHLSHGVNNPLGFVSRIK